MPARQLARSGRGRRKRLFPVSDAASRQIHPRAERRRRSASEARFSSAILALGWTTTRVPRKRQTGCPHQQHAGAAGAGSRPVVPHAPTANGRTEDRRALEPDESRGDDARLDFGRDANSSLDPHPEEVCAAGRLEWRGPIRERSDAVLRGSKRRRPGLVLRDATPSPLRASARLLRTRIEVGSRGCLTIESEKGRRPLPKAVIARMIGGCNRWQMAAACDVQ